MTGNGGSAASKHVKSHFRKLHDATKGLHKLRLIEWSAAGKYNILHINETMKSPYIRAQIKDGRDKFLDCECVFDEHSNCNYSLASWREASKVQGRNFSRRSRSKLLASTFSSCCGNFHDFPNAERRKLFVFPDWATDAVLAVCLPDSQYAGKRLKRTAEIRKATAQRRIEDVRRRGGVCSLICHFGQTKTGTMLAIFVYFLFPFFIYHWHILSAKFLLAFSNLIKHFFVVLWRKAIFSFAIPP